MMFQTQDLVESFDKFNQDYFSGCLQRPHVLEVESDMDTEVGYCTDDDGVVVLGVADNFLNRYQFDCVILHEMTHLWQMQNCETVGHNRSFKAFKKTLKKQGWEI
jgi:predicted metal-dependent hydrolase